MRIRCSLIFAETTFADEERWSKCWSRCFMKCWSRCWLSCLSKCRLMIWWGCQRVAFNAEAVGRTGGFAVSEMLHLTLKLSDALTDLRCQKCGTWHWGDQMHWRIFGFAREAAFNAETVECIDGFSNLSERLHSTLKRLDALTDWRFFLNAG